MNTNKIFYWIATGIMCFIFLFSAQMYLRNYEMVTGFFKNLGFPTWLIFPMAMLKILGVVAILSKLSKFLKELAYAGFLFNGIMALSAHVIAKDGGHIISLIAVISVVVSWIFDRKVII